MVRIKRGYATFIKDFLLRSRFNYDRHLLMEEEEDINHIAKKGRMWITVDVCVFERAG